MQTTRSSTAGLGRAGRAALIQHRQSLPVGQILSLGPQVLKCLRRVGWLTLLLPASLCSRIRVVEPILGPHLVQELHRHALAPASDVPAGGRQLLPRLPCISLWIAHRGSTALVTCATGRASTWQEGSSCASAPAAGFIMMSGTLCIAPSATGCACQLSLAKQWAPAGGALCLLARTADSATTRQEDLARHGAANHA